jgi:tetratricopeptide (TPR) repeat protein
MFNLASVRNDMGESDGAIEMMREILRLWREAQGNEHPQVATGAITLGVWLGEAGDFSEAEALLDEGILIRRSAFGDNHPRVAIALIAKANLLLASGRVDEALQLAQQAQSSLLENLPEDHWSVAYAGSAVGAALVEQEQYERAESILLSSVEPLKLAPISGAKEKHRIRLAALYDGWGKPEEAAKFKASN